jgi:hypothetical protein
LITPAHIFARTGQVLFGSGHDWKAQLGAALMIKPDSIDAMARGKSRIPPGVWNELAGLLQDRANELPTLRVKVLDQAAAASGKVVFLIGACPAVVGGAPAMGGPISEGVMRWTENDRVELQRSLDDVTRRADLARGKVTIVGPQLRIEVPGGLDQGAMDILAQWFQVNERARLSALVSQRTGGQLMLVLTGPTQTVPNAG